MKRKKEKKRKKERMKDSSESHAAWMQVHE